MPELRSAPAPSAPALPAPPAVELRGLGHAFGDRVVLRDVDLRLEAGGSLALFGANGAGKSTLLRVVAGLLRPLRGAALLDGVPATDVPPELRARIGYVGHRPLVWGGLTPRENLELAARLYGLPAGAVDRELRRVGLTRRADDRTRALSQGMRQRLGLARALLPEPGLLVLDEPHAGLDEEGVELLDGVIAEARGRATVLLATHDRARGAELCERTATVAGGSVA